MSMKQVQTNTTKHNQEWMKAKWAGINKQQDKRKLAQMKAKWAGYKGVFYYYYASNSYVFDTG